jgi:hypothetical protein
MRTVNTQRNDIWDDEARMNDIIYLPQRQPYERKRTYRRRRWSLGSSEAFWNVIFSVLCLSVLACLFLH